MEERYAANVVDQPGVSSNNLKSCVLCHMWMLMRFFFIYICIIVFQGTKKTLILREIPEDRVKKFLANKESLAACDVAVVVYDRLAQKLLVPLMCG